MTDKMLFYMRLGVCMASDPKFCEELVQRAKTQEQAEKIMDIRLEYLKSMDNVEKYYKNKIEEILR